MMVLESAAPSGPIWVAAKPEYLNPSTSVPGFPSESARTGRTFLAWMHGAESSLDVKMFKCKRSNPEVEPGDGSHFQE